MTVKKAMHPFLFLFLLVSIFAPAAGAEPMVYRPAADRGTLVHPVLRTDFPRCESLSDIAAVGLLQTAAECDGSGVHLHRSAPGRFFTFYRSPFRRPTEVKKATLSVRTENGSDSPATLLFTLLASDSWSGSERVLTHAEVILLSGKPPEAEEIALEIADRIPAGWALALRADYVRGRSDQAKIFLEDLTLTVDEKEISCEVRGELKLDPESLRTTGPLDLTSMDFSRSATDRRYRVIATIPGKEIEAGPGVSAAPYGGNSKEYNHETILDVSGPASATGTIDRIQVHIADPNGAQTMKFFTASISHSTVTPHDVETVVIEGGGLQTFRVDLKVREGDFIGYYDGGAYIDQSQEGGGVLYASEDQTGKSEYHSVSAPWSSNLRATGITVGGSRVLFSGETELAREVATDDWPQGKISIELSARDAVCGDPLPPVAGTLIWLSAPR